MRQLYLSIALITCFCFRSQAQLISGETFLQGDYVEVGVAGNGSFGTGNDAPAGYHPRGVGSLLGFVADPDKDGWTAGTPNYIGDYFLPGSPQEGWDMEVAGVWAQAWRGSGPTSMTGGLSGTCTGYTATGGTPTAPYLITGIWEGTLGALKITQTTKLKRDKLYFTTTVKLKNTGSTTMYNFYYNRTVDPDNEVAVPGGGSFTTKNKIVYSLPSTDNKTLVVGIGEKYSAYLGLGSRDCRAKPYIVTSGLTPTDSLHELYSGQGVDQAIFKDSLTQDVGIGIVFKIDSLRAGDSTLLAYAYVLSEKDLDSAFEDLKPIFNIAGKAYLKDDTIRACIGTKLDVDILNADYYDWTWSPTGGLSTAKGSRVTITVGSSQITYKATPSSTLCTLDPLTITIIPVPNPPGPAAPSPLYYCQHEVAPNMTASPEPGAVLRWYTSATGGTSSPTLSPLTNTVGTKTYYVSQFSAGGCESDRTPVVVITRALPTIATFTFTSPTECNAKDGTITFFVDSANKPYTLYFDKDGSGMTPISFTSDASRSYTITGLGGGSYTSFYVVNKYGCKSLPYFGPIDLIDPIPDGPPLTNNGPVCVGKTAELTAPLLPGVTYSWTGPDGFSSTLRNPSFVMKETSAGDYTLIVKEGDCTYRPSVTTLVLAPTPRHQDFNPQQLCEGTDLKVELLRDAGNSYAWTGNGINLFDQDLVIPAITLAKGGYYLLTSTSDEGCVTLDSVLVKVDQLLTVTFGDDISICAGDSAQLSVQSDGPSVSWTPVTGLNNPNSFTPKASPSGTITYVPVAHSGTTCPDVSGEIEVTVIPAPTVVGYDTLVRMNVPYTIMPVYSQDAIKWRWVPSDSLSCDNCPNPVFNSRTDKTYVVYATNATGCTSSDEVTIRVFCDGASVTMPNAFTPNNDGHNDLYYVRGNGFSVKRFVIYNRLGQEVFHKENFMPNDRNYGWDGTMNGAAISEAAGFVYMLEVVCFNSGDKPMVMKGTVLLIR